MKNPYIALLQYIWRYGAGMRGTFILYYSLFVVGSIVIMLQPIFFGLFLNTVQTGGPDMLLWITIYLSVYALLNLVKWCFHGPARLMEQRFSLHVEAEFVRDSYQKLMDLPLRWHKDHHSGDTVSRIRKASTALRSFVDDGYMYIETITRLVTGLIALMWIHLIIGFFGLVVGIIALFVILAFDKKFVPQMKQYNNHEHTVHSLLFDYIMNAVTVVILRLEGRTQTAVAKRYNGLMPFLKKHAATNEWKWFTVSMIVAAVNLAVLLYYCIDLLSIEGTILVGTLVALYQYLERFINQFFNFTWQYGKIVSKHTDFLSIMPILEDHRKLVDKSATLAAPSDWKQIHIQNLHFTYKNGEQHQPILHDLSLNIERGKRYAFVGESGSGKSTLLTLLRGIEEMDTGTIVIDGVSFPTTHALSSISTLCPQDPEIFENTIEYNISVDIPHSPKEMEQVLTASCFAPVLKRLPKGIATDIKEKGVNLSGGEKQRLALARGLFAAKNSSLLLLDEPTSSVDPKNEKAIYETIFDLHQKDTIISSIHRLHLLPLFDYIYVFDKGRCIEEGTFETLTKQPGALRDMWQHFQATMKT